MDGRGECLPTSIGLEACIDGMVRLLGLSFFNRLGKQTTCTRRNTRNEPSQNQTSHNNPSTPKNRHLSLPMPSPALPDFSRGADGLLPAIAQDAESGTVLMLAWMNQQAWEETLRTGRATYFSRSRNQLWCKGDTSGHIQLVVEARVDCDADAILLLVRQTGAACHENYRSCFFRTIDQDGSIHFNQSKLDSA